MPGLTELLDANKDAIFRVLRLAVPAVAGMLASMQGSEWVDRAQADHLQRTEAAEARHNDAANYRGYVEETIEIRARCDAALEAFHYHRNDEGDYRRMLEACHSDGEIE